MNESIVKILKPTPKVQPKLSESELPSTSTQPQETSLSEESLELESEPTDIAEPASMRYAQMNPSGWRVSDILREIRLVRHGVNRATI